MSDKLAISAALSVLMMSAYVLLGSDAIRVPIGPPASSALIAPVELSLPALPRLDRLVPLPR